MSTVVQVFRDRRLFFLSSRKMTVGVHVDPKDRIVKAPPIVRKFVGQPLSNLTGWMQQQGDFRMEEIK